LAHDIRSIGRRLLMLANAVFGLGGAAVLVVLYVRPSALGAYDEATQTVRIAVRGSAALELAVVIAVLLLGLTALHLLYGRRPKEPLRFVPSQAPGGVVRVAREALEAALRSAGESLDVVTRLRVAVEQGGLKRILVRAFFQAPEGATIQEASRELRAALAHRFSEMVRLGDGVRAEFEIEFVGFAGRLNRKAEPEAKEEPPAFTGPKYPIGDEDPMLDGSRGS
jgi:hypothetical protein